MAMNRLASVLGLLGLGSVLAMGTAGQCQQPPPPNQPQAARGQDPTEQQGMDVLASGPIHEAYAEPVDYKPQPTPVIAKQPPDPIPEIPPDQKPAGENVEWIPGYWSWDDTRNDYVWVSGLWRVPPPDQQWVPGYWNQAQGGWQWVPGFWTAAAQVQGQQQEQVQLQYLPPPPERMDAAPSTPAPDPNSVYVPGTWIYETADTRYAWRPGYWVDYQAGWVWTPARYSWTPAGYVFADGHWDYELERRGLMFAPVYFRERLWLRPSWSFQPSYCVHPNYLLSCLFVRPSAYCYYFGDYYAASYAQQGFVPWISFRLGRVGYDPLFSYYRWTHRDDRRWVNDLRTVYDGRLRGDLARPPRTLRDQIALVNNMRTKNGNIASVNLVNGVASLSRVNQSFVNLRPVTKEEHVAHQQFAREMTNFAHERQQAGQGLVTGKAIPRQPTDRPQVARVTLPKPPLAAREAERNHVQGRPQTLPGTLPPETKPETRPQAQPKTKSQQQPQPEARPPQQARPEARAAPQPQQQPPEARRAPQPQPRPEAKPASQPHPSPPQARPAPPPQRPQPPPRPDRPAPKPQQHPPEKH